ncbi:MAG: dTDP-glucose 4,6-dehydratase [Myxococcota bacterium]
MSKLRHAPSRILITGGAGFIGSNLVHHLLRTHDDLQIVNLDAMTYAASPDHLADLSDPSRHRLVEGDICDRSLVDALFAEGIDTVIHLAAESHVDRSIAGPAAFIETNIMGTYTLLEAARAAWSERQDVRFHHVSTDEVYGDLGPDDPAFTETTRYLPSSPYSASKASSDHLVRAWAHTYGLPTTVSNCSNNYGPRQHSEKLIPVVIRSCLTRSSIPVYGRGENVRDWLFVTDHCRAIDHIVRHGQTGATYNVGGNEEWANLALVQRICRTVAAVIEVPAQELLDLITFVTDRPGHDRRYAIDNTQIQALGWSPIRTLDDGLLQTVRWYVEHARTEPVMVQSRNTQSTAPTAP